MNNLNEKNAIVIGGGIMGVGTAWALIKKGLKKVILLDSRPLPRQFGGASVDASRSIRYQYGKEKGYMIMVADAMNAYRELFKDLGEELYTQTGSLSLQNNFISNSLLENNLPITQLDSYNSILEYKDDLGINIEYLEVNEIKKRFPYVNCDNISFGTFTPDAGILNAAEIIEKTVEWIRNSSNGMVLDGPEYEVTKVIPKEKSIENINNLQQNSVVLKNGKILNSDYIVVAVNSFTNDLIPEVKEEGKLNPVRAEITYFNVPEDEVDLWKSRPIIRELIGENSFYFFPFVGGKGLPGIKVGDYKRDYNFDMHNDDTFKFPKKGFNDQQIEWFNNRFLTSGQNNSLFAKVCHFDLYEDDRFQILSLDSTRSVIVLYGISGHGFKFGPIVGKSLASIITNENSWEGTKEWLAGKTLLRFANIK